MGPVTTQLEVKLTVSDIDAYQAATHRRLRSSDRGLSLFLVSRWLASPVVKGELARLCPPGWLPIHVRQLSRRIREFQPGRSYTVEVDYLQLDAQTPGVRLDYRVLDTDRHCAANGQVDLHFVQQSKLLGWSDD